MKIVSIERYKSNLKCIELDTKKTIYIHDNIVMEKALAVGMSLTRDDLIALIESSDRRCAWEQALKLLDYRAHSYTELFDKLSKYYTESVCFDTLNRLTELGMINDRSYAELLADKFIEGNKYGYYRASFEMQKHGLDKELCDEVLEKYRENSADRLFVLVGRKYSRHLTDDAGIQKVKSALVRQGYSYDEIDEVLDRYLNDTD